MESLKTSKAFFSHFAHSVKLKNYMCWHKSTELTVNKQNEWCAWLLCVEPNANHLIWFVRQEKHRGRRLVPVRVHKVACLRFFGCILGPYTLATLSFVYWNAYFSFKPPTCGGTWAMGWLSGCWVRHPCRVRTQTHTHARILCFCVLLTPQNVKSRHWGWCPNQTAVQAVYRVCLVSSNVSLKWHKTS